MERERWRKVLGFEGLYLVSSYGKVYSNPRTKSCGHPGSKPQLVPGKMMTPSPDFKGYLCVALSKNGKCTHKKIHRLVAEAFIPNPESKPQVNHLDRNKQNNYLENLEWATPQEDTDHVWKTARSV